MLPKQIAFLKSTARETMYSGAVRAGKTYALCVATAMRARNAGAREILCRKTLSTLKSTTLKTLLEGDGFNPPVLAPGTYEHRKADKEIKLKGGGEIVYFALVNDGAEGVAQRAGSYSGTGVNIDEATELDEADYRMLVSRASISHPLVPKQIRMACNPSTPGHFLAKRFAPPGSGFTTPTEGCLCISTRTHENTFLDADYVKSLDRDRGTLWYRRFVEGLWCGAEGLVYDKWDRAVHVQTRPRSEFNRFIVACDEGYTNPFVALLIGIDGDGRMHVIHEVYRPKMLIDEKVSVVREYGPVEAVIVDPSAADVRAQFIASNIPAMEAENEVLAGIQRVQSRLSVQMDGRPRLTVDPSCEHTIKEFETYQWKPKRDEPVKAHDHAMDAIRYAAAYVDGSGVFAEVFGAQNKKRDVWDTDGPEWEVWNA